jgi:hypothetical protein
MDFDRGPIQNPLGISGPVKRLSIVFLLLAAVLFSTYLALPLWLPLLVQTQLAQGWRLESLAFDYPFNSTLQVNDIVVGNRLDGIELRVTARDLNIDVYRPSLDVGRMDVDINFTESPAETTLFTLDDLRVPVIIRPGVLPQISIDSLRVNLQTDRKAGESWLFEDLRLDRNAPNAGRLKTTLPLPELEGLSGVIEIGLLHDLLEAHLQLQGPDNSKVFQIEFRQTAGNKDISSEITGQGQLQALRPLLMSVFHEPDSALDQLKRMEGQVSFEAHFAGSDEQILNEARIRAQNVTIGMENESLALDLDVQLLRQQDWVHINFLTPGTFHLNAQNEFASDWLSDLLPIARQNGSLLEGESENLDLTIEALSNFKLQTNAPFSAAFSGAASVKLSSTLLDLSLALAPESQFRMSEALAPQSLTGRGIVNIELQTEQALIFKTKASASMPQGASLLAAGLLELDGNTIRFAESTAFHAFTPRLIADFESERLDLHDLEFSGEATFMLPLAGNEPATEFQYSGNVQGQHARISQSPPGHSAQTILDSGAMNLQMDFSLSGDQIGTNGVGTLHTIRMVPSGISASQVDLEWSKVDPLAATGEFRTHTRGLALSLDDGIFQGIDLDVNFTLLSGSRVNGRGDLLVAGDVSIPLRFNGKMGADDWLVNIPPSQLSLRQAAKALEISGVSIPAELKLGDGTIDIKGSFKTGDTIQGNMVVKGKTLSLSLAESTVEGAEFNITGTLTDTFAGSGSFFIDRIKLAAGLNLFQTQALIVLMTPEIIELQNLQAEFFGGHLVADRIRLTPEGLTDTQIKLTGIDLGQILEYIDVGGLKGTGDLEISLPSGSQGSSLYVQKGAFRANGPGILRYSGSISAAPTDNIGLSALENFHFTELDGTIDYNPDGSYRLKVHLAGSNPDLYNGYPIALNLNIGGMLPEAFEVLFLSGDFDKAILGRIRQDNSD